LHGFTTLIEEMKFIVEHPMLKNRDRPIAGSFVEIGSTYIKDVNCN
jgi:hypothetical protein